MTYVLLAFSVVALVSGQFMFKTVALRGTFGLGLIHDPVGLALFVGALTIYAVSTIAWIFVLRTMPLSTAYPFLALGFAVMPFLSHLAFGEPLTTSLFVGTAMIISGILVIFAYPGS